ncbi:MAG: TIGR03936 family radical SAM-associated protein [Coriobacteriales bacterium]|jgi:radical SAM-linked protein|nr:TIGR03936 family radical SAM-associated protein [Coriobacteriales bacterium]
MSFRLRICYGKTGRLRYLSHLELVRAMERLIRRAQLPFVLSQGFNVHMKHAFGPALPVGTAGLCEYLDVWLSSYLAPSEVCERLRAATVPEMVINEVSYCRADAPSLQISHVLAHYRLIFALPDAAVAEAFKQKFAALLAYGSITIIKKNKPKEIDLTLRVAQAPEYFEVGDLSMVSEAVGGQAGGALLGMNLVLRSNESGSLRPEALFGALAKDWNEEAVPPRLVEITRILLAEEAEV